MYFNGTAIQIASVLSGSAPFTIDAWVYSTDASACNIIWSHGGSNSAQVTGGVLSYDKGVFNYYCSGFLIKGTNNYPGNQWYHVALVGNSTNIKLYINGTLEGTYNGAYNFSNVTTTFGWNDSAPSLEYFRGYMDEIRVSNVAQWTTNFTPPTAPHESNSVFVTPGGTIPMQYAIRRRMMAMNKLRLPAAYQEVAYIQSTGTQYIDTGVQPTVSTKINFGINMAEETGAVIIGDCTGEGYPGDYQDWRIFNYSGVAYFDVGESRVNSGAFAANTYYDVECGNFYVKLNGTTVAQGTTVTGNPIGTFTAKIFYRTSGATFSKGRLYYLKMYNGATLIRDFVPCYRKSDGVAGLYDMVNKSFYTNEGTGSFIVGHNV